MMGSARCLVLAMTVLMTACGPANNDPGPGGVSVEDARALDEAAAQLDQPPVTAKNTESESE